MIINIFLCVLFSYFLTYLFIPIFKKKSWVSLPNERTSHRGIIPVGVSLGFIFVSSINFILNKEYYFFFLILSLLGFADDLKSLGNKLRLFIQIIIGIIFFNFNFQDSILNFQFLQIIYLLKIFWLLLLLHLFLFL